MSLTVKVSIIEAWNEDGKGWVAEVKDFGLTSNARTFEQTVEQIQPKIEEYLQKMFGTEKRVVASVGAATGKIEFEIDVQKDRSLDEFVHPLVKIAKRPDAGKILETANTIMEISKSTGIPPMEVFNKAKSKLRQKKNDIVPEAPTA